jgi:endonuclease/exonuclease/phosphatase family metal-dependent hydrolase
MKNRFRFTFAAAVLFAGIMPFQSRAQFPMSIGPYAQNFDSLGAVSAAWTDNSTLGGWYISKSVAGAVTGYTAGTGSSGTGAIYSYGVAGVSTIADRALGSVASATSGIFAYGVRFTNDTAATLTNFSVTYTGEQWRNSGVATTQSLAFSYRISNSPITSADAANANSWTAVTALNFNSPTVGGTATPLDGNAATNRQFFSVTLIGASVGPGQEIFFRWRDTDDIGTDHGLAIDDLAILYNLGDELVLIAPIILANPQSTTVLAGDSVQFNALATGNPAPQYQWQFNSTNIPGATSTTLQLNSVTTNAAGSYRVIATNSEGSATSEVATLTVSLQAAGVSLLTYNVKGNGATDWSTNAAQVQAIARQLQYLQPDVITFNEIPWDLRYEMTNFIAAFLPGYKLAVSTGTDGSICSAIASRFTITRASKWLDGIDLRSFGYSNANNALDNFTRDLFEAQIAVPGFARPLHVYTTHLKATSSGAEYDDNAAKRAAEATAITNFFATNLFALYPYDLYVLTGDMNASDTNELCIQKLLSPPTGLTMTYPRNPVSGSFNTYSTTTANPGSRLDYIFPGPLLYSNIKTSQVFRTDRLTPLPPNLNSNDCKVASDHLPVLMVFNNPYDKPFRLLSVARTNPTVTLQWESVFGQPYRVEASSNLTTWTTQANNLVALGTNSSYSTNLNEALRFFRIYRLP